MRRALFVGPCPNRRGENWHRDDCRSVSALASLLGVEVSAMRERFAFCNLLGEVWLRPPPNLLRAAAMVMLPAMSEHGAVVLCGGDVAEAFGLASASMFSWTGPGSFGVAFGRFPHPSPKSRFWNYPEQRKRARAFLQQLYAEVAL